MRKDTKKYLIDKVTAEDLKPLSFRIFQGIYSQFIRFYAMTFFSLSVIGVIQKMAPVITVICAYTFLKEKISKLDYALIFTATAASVLVTLGDADQGTNSYNYVCLFFLLLNPVFAGSSNIALRKLKKTSSQTLTSWTNIMQVICMGAPMVVFG